MKSRNNVIIAGNFMFPKGNAGGKRVLGLGYILRSLHYDVTYIGTSRNKESDILKTKKTYEDFTYYEIDSQNCTKSILSVGEKYQKLTKVVEEIGKYNIALIILYGSPSLAIWDSKVLKYGKEHDIKVVFDCVDWIERTGSKNKIKNIIKYIDTNYMKRYIAKKCHGVISISSYLEDYYKKSGCNVVRIPPVGKNEYDEAYEHRDPDKGNEHDLVCFLYAGEVMPIYPANKKRLKDRIDLSVEIIYQLEKRGIKCHFDIYGIEQEEYIKAFPEQITMIYELSKRSVLFHGKVPNEEVCEKLRQSDFMLLNRDKNKVTIAGFPSKVSESYCYGIPVITNNTSDIYDYIENNINGVVISDDLSSSINQIAEVCKDRNLVNRMKDNCRKNNPFDYSRYEESFELFIKEI